MHLEENSVTVYCMYKFIFLSSGGQKRFEI
jgi:hypothetical protein